MNRAKNRRKKSIFLKFIAYAFLLTPILMLLFLKLYLPPISKRLTIQVQSVERGTENLQDYLTIGIWAHRSQQIGSKSSRYRSIEINANNFHLEDSSGAIIGRLDYSSKTTIPLPPNTYTLGVDGRFLIGKITFVGLESNLDKVFLVYKDDEKRMLKIPIELKLPDTF